MVLTEQAGIFRRPGQMAVDITHGTGTGFVGFH
jgi:hypothetical protein